jgi:hypothetical protein
MADLVVLYNTVTGAAVSLGTSVPTVIPDGLSLAVFTSPTWEEFQGDPGFVWDPITRTPQPRPVPVQIVVSENLRAKIEASIAEIINVGFPAIDAAKAAIASLTGTTIPNAKTTVAPLKTVTVSNVAAVQVQLRNIGNYLDALLDVDAALAQRLSLVLTAVRELASRDVAIARLMLGDFYGDAEALASEAGTEDA